MTVHTSRGRYYEEMVTGDVYKHDPGRTITEADNVLFCSITLNSQSLHLDAARSAESEFGQRLVNSLLTMSIVCSIGVPQLTQKTTIANLGFQEIAFPAPVFLGDTLYCETEIGPKRLSASRPGQGIVTLEHRGLNQDGVLVCRAVRTALVHCLPEDERGA
ncbi:MaoC family dehydratase [Nocardioides lianchengensis]|uniref:Acyl dehydratase n=1 Tax=Nocardioides lianchengensis TaxID=1045774 RepID=A0A1G7BHA1_9ACTN|nr:MaoC family dehydratase [Nocardioides lianchengensis]NYG08996.1 acyl dehydratase [Nocardioides lianchengensis]SDE26491.1 Acyl dehydratase [Nocardioides lianchengensis]